MPEAKDGTSKAREADGLSVLKLERHPALVLMLDTPKGRAIHTTSPIPAHTLIETSPVLIFPPSDLIALKTTEVDHYSYNWPITDPITSKTVTTQAIALGLGSLFNHSARNQNVGFRLDVQRQFIEYITLRDVRAGEELCISYGERIWFQDVEGHMEEGKEDVDDPLGGIVLDEG